MEDVYEQLMTAVVADNTNEVRRLIAMGIDLNHRCDQGASVLFGAILHGNPLVVRLFLEHGADPNLIADEPAASIYTDKPLALARQARFLMDWDKYAPIVGLLAEFGATDSEGRVESTEDLLAVETRARAWQAKKAALVPSDHER